MSTSMSDDENASSHRFFELLEEVVTQIPLVTCSHDDGHIHPPHGQAHRKDEIRLCQGDRF